MRNYAAAPLGVPRSPGRLAPWQLRRVTEYLEQHLEENVSLATLAGLVGLSQAHFSRAFRRSTGMPPHQYQLAARVRHAKDLLLHGDLPLTGIAAHCGFSDVNHLCRAFRRQVGMPPRRLAP